jgi:hypothetical protein
MPDDHPHKRMRFTPSVKSTAQRTREELHGEQKQEPQFANANFDYLSTFGLSLLKSILLAAITFGIPFGLSELSAILRGNPTVVDAQRTVPLPAGEKRVEQRNDQFNGQSIFY